VQPSAGKCKSPAYRLRVQAGARACVGSTALLGVWLRTLAKQDRVGGRPPQTPAKADKVVVPGQVCGRMIDGAPSGMTRPQGWGMGYTGGDLTFNLEEGSSGPEGVLGLLGRERCALVAAQAGELSSFSLRARQVSQSRCPLGVACFPEGCRILMHPCNAFMLPLRAPLSNFIAIHVSEHPLASAPHIVYGYWSGSVVGRSLRHNADLCLHRRGPYRLCRRTSQDGGASEDAPDGKRRAARLGSRRFPVSSTWSVSFNSTPMAQASREKGIQVSRRLLPFAHSDSWRRAAPRLNGSQMQGATRASRAARRDGPPAPTEASWR
jgi:hypothetical protein